MLRRTGLLLGLGGAVLLMGCQKPETGAAVEPGSPEAQADQIRIAVVPKGTAHQFWTTVKAGADRAGQELGVDILWKGPDAETDIAAQKGIVEDLVTQQVDAIVMAACDADALVPNIQDAEKAGIPVITIDSGVNTEVRCLVATDNVAGGRIAGETLFKLIGGAGEVGLIPFVQGAASSEDREKGFKQACDAATGIELVAIDYCDSDEAKAKNVTADMLTAHPNLKGIFAANEPAAIGAANALNEAGRAGEVKLVAYDGSPSEVKLLQEGTIQALILQDPFRMGYDGVKQAMKAIQGGEVDQRVDTGVTVATSESVESDDVQRLLNPTAAVEETPATP